MRGAAASVNVAAKDMAKSGTIFTVGHSTRKAAELAALLKSNEIEAVADVRTIPKSRRLPHFNAVEMTRWLPENGIAYLPFRELGGLRKARKDSINLAWKNESFRGYADYMLTPDFAAGLERLMDKAHQRRVAIMCAEAVPWRCHRSLIADALVVRDWQVWDILAEKSLKEHKFTPFAQVKGLRITYPREDDPFEGEREGAGR